MRLFCKHNYKLRDLEQYNGSGKITSILKFVCEKCGKKQEFITTRLLLNETNVSKSYLKRERERLESILTIQQQKLFQMSLKIKEQQTNERIISIYRPIVHNAKRLSVNELKNIQMEILERPNEEAGLILQRRIEILQTEIEQDEKKLQTLNKIH